MGWWGLFPPPPPRRHPPPMFFFVLFLFPARWYLKKLRKRKWGDSVPTEWSRDAGDLSGKRIGGDEGVVWKCFRGFSFFFQEKERLEEGSLRFGSWIMGDVLYRVSWYEKRFNIILYFRKPLLESPARFRMTGSMEKEVLLGSKSQHINNSLISTFPHSSIFRHHA